MSLPYYMTKKNMQTEYFAMNKGVAQDLQHRKGTRIAAQYLLAWGYTLQGALLILVPGAKERGYGENT